MEVSMRFKANNSTYNLVRRATSTTVIHGFIPICGSELRSFPKRVSKRRSVVYYTRKFQSFFCLMRSCLVTFSIALTLTASETLFVTVSILFSGIPALQLAEHDVAELSSDAVQRQAKALRDVEQRDRIDEQLRTLRSQQESSKGSKRNPGGASQSADTAT